MKNLQKLFILIMISLSLNSMSQTIGDYIDVVYLKNGSKVKGIIVEQIPGKSVKIKTTDGSEYVYPITEVLKFAREQKDVNTAKADKNNNSDGSNLNWMTNFKKKKSGYYIDIDYLMNSSGPGLRIINGYKFGKTKYIGLALGVENFKRGPYVEYYDYNYGAYDQVPMATANLVFTHDILDYRITPFYQLEAGYAFALERMIHFDDGLGLLEYRNYGGPMLGMTTGLKFKTKKKIVYKLGLDLKVSSNYSYNEYHYRETLNSPIKINSGEYWQVDPAIGLRFGIGF